MLSTGLPRASHAPPTARTLPTGLPRASHRENAPHGPPRSGRGPDSRPRPLLRLGGHLCLWPQSLSPQTPRPLWLREPSGVALASTALPCSAPASSAPRSAPAQHQHPPCHHRHGCVYCGCFRCRSQNHHCKVILALEAAAPGRRGRRWWASGAPNPCDPLPSAAAAPSRA